MFICEEVRNVAIGAFVKDPAEEMGAEFIDKILGPGENSDTIERGINLPLQQDPVSGGLIIQPTRVGCCESS